MDKKKTPSSANTRMPLTSANVTAERKDALRQLFPEVFAEGKIDFAKLKLVLGEEIDEGPERYGLSWAGKADAIRAIQVPSTGTLVPVRDESVDFDSTENLMIEGDNLEVLKLLQKAYHGKIKMIYIDPPYNTGKEFIYEDNFREGLQAYLRYSGQVDGEGAKLTSNTETSGRYHSKWLTMMYPRLFLARNLLREDGVIFVSIDDHEVHNLRHLMDEIFGSENFIGQLVWRSRVSEDTRAKSGLSNDHEYLMCYRRSETGRIRGVEKDLNKFSNPDNDPRGPWRSADLTGLATKDRRPNLHYDLIDPATGTNYGCPPKGWRYDKSTMATKIKEGRILWPPTPQGRPRHKLFLNEMKSAFKNASSVLLDFSTADGTRETNVLLGDGVFSFPKPTRLIEFLVEQATASETEDLVLDFFAGSGSTGEAVMRANANDSGNRRFILVQLPEPTGRDDYRTIADITKARLHKAAEAIRREFDGKLNLNGDHDIDLGFRTYKLTSSNFKIWEPPSGDPEAIAEQLDLYADSLVPGAKPEAILYELMLKAGIPLTARVEKLELGGQEVFSIEDGRLFICLADPITRECIRAMIAKKPQMVICLDHAFRGNDQLLTNTVLEMKSHGVEHFRTV